MIYVYIQARVLFIIKLARKQTSSADRSGTSNRRSIGKRYCRLYSFLV